MRKSPSKTLGKIVIFLIFTLFSLAAYSQIDVEKATRETDRLGQKEKIEEKLRQPPSEKPPEIKPPEAPVAKEEQKFFVKKINLEGCETFSPQDFSSSIAKYENRELTLSDLSILAREIEQGYLKRGVIAPVFLSPQEIKEGVVTLQVVEARMGDLQIQEHKYFKKKRLNYYWKIPAGEILHYDKISQGVQLMNKNPDRLVRAALRRGKKPGTTDVLLTPQTRFPVHLTASFDNEGSASTGKGRTGLGIRHNNFLGLEDTVLAGYSFGNYFDGIYAYHSLPLNYNGASLLYGYSRSESKPTKEYAPYGIKSEVKDTSISLHQDLYQKDEYLGEVFLGFEAKDKTVRTNDGPYNRDRLRIFNLGANLIRRDLKSTTSISPELSQGVAAFGASKRHNPLASREAKSTFSKFNLDIQQRRVLPWNLQANLKFKTQIASTKLTPQEEFSLGGIDSVRGYPSGDYSADNAILSSAELLIPSLFIPKSWRLPYAQQSLREQTTALVFVDYGWGKRRGPAAFEKKSADLLGIGVGLRFNLFDQAILRLEWGFPVASNRPITEAGHSQFHFSVDFQEKLPGEIERIRKLREAAKKNREEALITQKEIKERQEKIETEKKE
jgi:hemolysin activation/secretion protein